jgi:hypothetical protein
MAATETVTAQGSTFAWTESYGGSTKESARQFVRDTAFALALAVLISGVAGFVGYEKPAAATLTQEASFNM